MISLSRRLFTVLAAGIAFLACSAASVAQPYVKIVSPAPGECVPGPDVTVHFNAGGMCFQPCGNNIHFMLDNEPFQAQFDLSHPHVFHDVPPGTHTIRAYCANHLHEGIGGTLDVVTFSVAYPDEDNRPEFGEPVLTYNLPQGEYLGIDAADVTLNFLVDGVPLSRRGYRVQYYVDGRRFIVYDCNTRHLKGLAPGYHSVKVELVDEKGRVAPGPFNSVERLILLSPDKMKKTYSPDVRYNDLPKIDSIHGAMTRGWPSVAVDEVPPLVASAGPRVRRDLTVRQPGTARIAPQSETSFRVRDDSPSVVTDLDHEVDSTVVRERTLRTKTVNTSTDEAEDEDAEVEVNESNTATPMREGQTMGTIDVPAKPATSNEDKPTSMSMKFRSPNRPVPTPRVTVTKPTTAPSTATILARKENLDVREAARRAAIFSRMQQMRKTTTSTVVQAASTPTITGN